MNIYQISEELLDIYSQLEENGGELTDELEKALTVTQEDFATKVEDYTKVIKSTKNDISAIDAEVKRLRELKESKQKVIARLEKVLIWAISMFGEQSKTGGKYYDYGTGKVSVRNSTKVEVDETKTETVVDTFFAYLNNLDDNNAFDFQDELDCKEIADIITKNGCHISDDDLRYVSANLSLDIPISDMFTKEGYAFAKHLSRFIRTNFVKPKSNVNKTRIKDYLKTDVSDIAHIVENKTLQIK